MSIHNQIRAFAGIFILISLTLAHYHSNNWLFFTAFVGLNLFQSSFTGFCPLEIILRKIQNKPLLNDQAKPWNERYARQEYYYGTEPNDFLKQYASKITPHGKVLCLAEGEGRNAVYLAKLGFNVTAVDQSVEGLKKLSSLAQLNSVDIKTIVADLSEYKILESNWDGIVSIWCHVPPELRRRLHAQVVQGLKKNGIFILESYHPKQLEFKTGGPPSAELMMTKTDLASELKGLQFEVLEEKNREIQEGKGHSGMSAVVQVLAKK